MSKKTLGAILISGELVIAALYSIIAISWNSIGGGLIAFYALVMAGWIYYEAFCKEKS